MIPFSQSGAYLELDVNLQPYTHLERDADL